MRVYNFSAGPAVLPEEVLKEAADEMLDYRGCGMSVMEMSHRSKVFDDIIKVKISKVDITTNEELPGAELVIKDKDGTEIDRWVSTNEPHYVEKMPAGDYTLTEIIAPSGYKVAESIDFTVLPTDEMQTVVMKDAREDTPTPPTPLLTIPKTGDNSPLGLLLAIAGISLAGLAVLVHKSARRKDIAPRDDDDEDTED